MKRVSFLKTGSLAAAVALLLSGCTLATEKGQTYMYERPAAGFTVEDQIITNVDLQKQNWIDLKARNSAITISRSPGKNLQIIEKRKLTGPALPAALRRILKEWKCSVKTDALGVDLLIKAKKELKPFYRMTEDIELKIPETLESVYISENSGPIRMDGLAGLYSAELSVNKGSIHVADCSSKRLSIQITEGNLDISDVRADGDYKCGRGDIRLMGVKGAVNLKSLSGETIVGNTNGLLNCDISTGSLTLENSKPEAGSLLYTSYGEISADLQHIATSGKYMIRASKGRIRLKVPQKGGWSLLAKSTRGKVINRLGSSEKGLERSPSGELYGDVRGGGALIDSYIDMGNIILENK